VTISGGEPFEQPDALAELLVQLRRWTDALPSPVDYLCYSGFPYETLRRKFSHILRLLDVLIPEPYLEGRDVAPLRGSDNQPVILLSELGQRRYGGKLDGFAAKRFQVAVHDGRIWFIGIPGREDMDRLEKICRERGLVFGKSSWRA